MPVVVPVLAPAEGQAEDRGLVQTSGPVQVHSLQNICKIRLTGMHNVSSDCYQAYYVVHCLRGKFLQGAIKRAPPDNTLNATYVNALIYRGNKQK